MLKRLSDLIKSGNIKFIKEESQITPKMAKLVYDGISQKVSELNLLGLTFEEAKNIVEKMGHQIRVTKLDGEDMILTMDFRLDRHNVEISDNKIVKYNGIN